MTLDKRMDWDPKFRKYLKELDEKKPVILCGDLNVSHKEIGKFNTCIKLRLGLVDCHTFFPIWGITSKEMVLFVKVKDCHLYTEL